MTHKQTLTATITYTRTHWISRHLYKLSPNILGIPGIQGMRSSRIGRKCLTKRARLRESRSRRPSGIWSLINSVTLQPQGKRRKIWLPEWTRDKTILSFKPSDSSTRNIKPKQKPNYHVHALESAQPRLHKRSSITLTPGRIRLSDLGVLGVCYLQLEHLNSSQSQRRGHQKRIQRGLRKSSRQSQWRRPRSQSRKTEASPPRIPIKVWATHTQALPDHSWECSVRRSIHTPLIWLAMMRIQRRWRAKGSIQSQRVISRRLLRLSYVNEGGNVIMVG